MSKILVLLSGGLDSATCLGLAVEKAGAENVIALNAYYGQRHKKEMECAKALTEYYGVEYHTADLSVIMQYSNSAMLSWSDQEVPHETYAEQTSKTDGKPVSTYVPFRNGLFLSAAASMGLSIGCSEVWYGAHADDAAGSAYPDCSVAFLKAINEAIREGTAGEISVIAPFIKENKAGVVREGLRLKVPYEITWSCYEGGEKPCGKCGTCIDRLNAFKENGKDDPLWKS